MNSILRKLVGLLGSPDPARRIAGAIALGEVAPPDVAIVKALGSILETADATLAPRILDALATIGSPAAAPYVLPLLDSDDLALKLRAAAVIAHAGTPALKVVRERLAAAKPAQKPVLVDVLARMGSREAFASLLDLLFDTDAELVKEVCEAVRRHASEAPDKERAAMYQQVVRFMSGARARKEERALAACLLLLGHIRRPEARAVLLKHVTSKTDPTVRRHALTALRHLDLEGAAATAVVKAVSPCLDDADEDIARLAMEVVAAVPTAVSGALWIKLMASPHVAVRATAALKLGEIDSDTAHRHLIGLLNQTDVDLRERAARALASHKSAAPLLVDAMGKATSVDLSWQLARILKSHAGVIDAKAVRRFAAMATADLKARHPRADALLFLLRNTHPRAADEALLEVGLADWRARRWSEAVECLKRLLHSEVFDDDARYALTVSNLKLSSKDLAAHARAEDHALRGVSLLLRSPTFKLAEHLEKDKTLDAADLFYVGFHFFDAPGEGQDFGRRVLNHVARTWPKTESGKAAKARLKAAK